MTGLRSLFQGDAIMARLRNWISKPEVRRAGLIVAILIFAVGTFVAARAIKLPASGIDYRPIALLVAFGIPATILLNTLEMELSARLVGRRFGFFMALSTTIMASAANMLPLPGAAMVRFAGLSGLGASARESANVTLSLALMWLGVGIGVTGLVIINTSLLLSAAAVLSGVMICAFALRSLSKVSGNMGLALACLALKFVMVSVSILRLLLCFLAIGVAVPFTEGAVFAVSGVAGSAVSIVPAGLGVRELVSSALAPMVSIDPAAAFLATAGDRLVELFVLLALAAPLALFARRAPTSD